jgi:alkylhydroperoxidase family enzyme
MILRIAITICVATILCATLVAEERASATPKPIPATRPEIKIALEALKDRAPRLPLPPAVDGEPNVNNGRMRAHYLPASWASSSGRPRSTQNSRGPWIDPNAKLDYALTRACFWVVSRGNNCHYCLGHQELALRHAGLDEDTIASIDSDWSLFDPRQQAALAFARKLTLEPQLIGDDDIVKLKGEFSDAEIIELTFNIARFNATNRWTDGLGIPQDRHFGEEANTLDTPTSESYQHTVSIVAPTTRTARPLLPTLDEVKQALTACGQRQPRVALPSVEDARKILGDAIGDDAPLAWERAMSQVPTAGVPQVTTWRIIMSDEHLTPRLKAELALIAAVHNRAWYAVGHASKQLDALGVTTDEKVALFDESGQTPSGPAAAYRLAAKSTADPHLITDVDIADVRAHYSDHETAQIMQVICMANLFDRFTEALGLPLEPGY